MLRQETAEEEARSERIGQVRDARDLDRLEAEGALERISPAEMEALVAVFERENRKKPWRFWLSFFGLIIALSVILVNIQVILLEAGIRFPLGSMVGAFSGAALGIGSVMAPTRLQKRLALRLAAIDDVHLIGPLLEMLDRQDAETRRIAEAALIRLLPRLRAGDRALLNERQRTLLSHELAGRNEAHAGWAHSKPNADLMIAMLRSLEQVGDASALKVVQRLADGKGMAKKNEAVRQAARECLPALESLVERERQAQTLLRPAEAPGAPADTLLRPASGAPASHPDALLRPAGGPGCDAASRESEEARAGDDLHETP